MNISTNKIHWAWAAITLACFHGQLFALDNDLDGIDDSQDNCLLIANPPQRDTNQNGFGNACDGDLDGDGIIDWDDINRTYWFFGVLGDTAYNPDADINGDDQVNATDAGLINVMMNTQGVPGPSAVAGSSGNVAPTITGNSIATLLVNQAYNFAPVAQDYDGDPLMFSIMNQPLWSQFNTSNGILSGSPLTTHIGSYPNIVITVSDGQDSASLPAFTLTVNSESQVGDVDGDAVLDDTDNCTLMPNTQQRDTNNNGYGNVCDGDLDGDGLINWDDINRSYWYFGTATDSSYNPDADINGDDRVDATDTNLIKTMMNATGMPGPSAVAGAQENSPPTISGGTDSRIQVNATYNFTPLANDSDGDTLSFTIINQPTWAQFNNASGALTGTPQTSDMGGYANIIISVSDGQASAALNPFSILVETSSTVPTIAGCQIFPADNFWNTPILEYPVHPKSSDYINNLDPSTELHPDFGDGERVNGELQSAYGIAYVVVSSDPEKYENNPDIYPKNNIPVNFQWWDESDCQIADTAEAKICQTNNASYPVPAQRIVEVDGDIGELANIMEFGTDRHLVSLDADTCQLYEVQHYDYTVNNDTLINVSGDSGAIWDLSKNEQRISNHTSADAAGLAILPGLVRFDEVFKKYDPVNGHQYGEINHAIRITLSNPQNAYILPATHSDGNQLGGCGFSDDSNCLPMGQKLRLKMSLTEINDSSFTEANKVILRAMRNYGLVVADTGGDLFVSGDHDPRWINEDVNINALKSLQANNFEAVIKPQGERVYEYSWSSDASVFYVPESPADNFGDDEFEFVVFGDFNQGGCERNDRVTELINLMATNENNSAAFYVSTGDLIDGYVDTSGGNLSFAANIDNSTCGAGAANGNIQQMLAPIKERAPFAGLSASFYPAIGNHDGGWGSGWYPDPWGQGICDMLTPNTPMDFINHTVPDLNGDLLTPNLDNATTINNLFCNKQDRSSSRHPDEFYYSFGYKNSHFIMLSLFHNYQSLNTAQMTFLENELSDAKDAGKHIFVFAHAPIYTTNYDRHDATQNWRAYADLFDTYGVDMYINGHNHSYERSFALKGDPTDSSKLIRDDNGTVYLTVGSAGGGSDGVPDISNPLTEVTALAPDWSQVKIWSKSAFAREITVYLKVKVKGASVSFETTTIGIDTIERINDSGNLIPLDEIILGPRQVDSGSLRKYP